MYLSRDLALYFHFKKGSDKPSNKFTIPTAAINSSNVFRWFGQHAFTKVFALEIDRSVTYESQFPCRFTFCTVCIHVFFCLFLFCGWHTGLILPFWTMLCVQCTSGNNSSCNVSAYRYIFFFLVYDFEWFCSATNLVKIINVFILENIVTQFKWN